MLRILPLVLAALLLAGCTSALEGAARALDTLSIVARNGEPILEAEYASEQALCLQDNQKVADAEACVAKVRLKWKPARDAYRAFRTVWIGADAALRAAQAAEAIGKGADMVTIAAKVGEAIAAADKFRVLMEQFGHPAAATPASTPTSLVEARKQLDTIASNAARAAGGTL